MLEFLNRHWTKIFGALVAVNGQLSANLASGQFAEHADKGTVFWLSQISSLLGVALVAVGLRNTTEQKVADAKAEVAKALDSAIKSTPGSN